MFDVPAPPPSASVAISAARETIRQTVERIAPRFELDETKVLTDAELEELRRQTAARRAARELAARSTPEELLDRIRSSAQRCSDTGKHALPPPP